MKITILLKPKGHKGHNSDVADVVKCVRGGRTDI